MRVRQQGFSDGSRCPKFAGRCDTDRATVFAAMLVVMMTIMIVLSMIVPIMTVSMVMAILVGLASMLDSNMDLVGVDFMGVDFVNMDRGGRERQQNG